MHREPLDPRDPAALVAEWNPIPPARSPSSSITKRPNDSGSCCDRSISASSDVAVEAADRAEERADVVVGQELDEEVDVVRPRAPDRDAAHVSGASARTRRFGRSAPVPSPTPSRTSTRPPIAIPAIGSPRKIAP